MVQYLAVTKPFARAIKCLEASESTPADVFHFWLAIMARLDTLFTKNKVGLSPQTVEEIRAIANQRFNELINDGPEDLYLSTFYLDPSTLW